MITPLNKNKYSQITIFVIVAIAIIALITIFFIIKKPSVSSGLPPPGEDPRRYIEVCTELALQDILPQLELQGGFSNPTSYHTYNGTKITFLCTAQSKEQLCINKHPMLNKEIEKEIYNLIKPKIDYCFVNLKNAMKEYNYQEDNMVLNITIVDRKLNVDIAKRISFTRNSQTQTIEDFRLSLNSYLSDFVTLSNRIINEELTCNCPSESCNADIINLNNQNRLFEITKPVLTGEGIEVYSIYEPNTKEKFYFAIKNCVLTI